MADSLLFDGSTAALTFSPGLALIGGPWTIAAIIKRGGDGSFDGIVTAFETAERWNMKLSDAADGNHLFGGNGATDSFSTTQILAANGWQMIVSTKASGTVAPRYHRYIYSTGAWLRVNGATAIADPTTLTSAGTIRVGWDNFSSFFGGNILIAAVWNTVVADATLDSMTGSYQAWVDAQPLEGWRFDRMTTISTFATRSGSSSVETVRAAGTSVAQGDVPAGWWDVLGTSRPKFDLASAYRLQVPFGTSTRRFRPVLPDQPQVTPTVPDYVPPRVIVSREAQRRASRW